ncbi:RHO1 GDP-GTP exchange protein 2, partial [Linderina pennispora]
MRKYTTPEPYNPDASTSATRTHTRASSVGFPLFMNRTSLGSSSSPSPALTMAHIGHDMIMIGRDSVDRASTAVDDDGYMYGSVGKQLHLWRDTIPQELLQQLEQTKIDQQEAIHELIMTEHDYLRDMELIDAIYVQPLMADRNVMERERAEQFIDTLFFNFRDLISDSHELCTRLAERQAQAPMVEQIGDIFLEWANKHLKNFIEYSVHVPISQAELEAELLRSPPMAEFLKQAETSPEARRLPIQSFIGRPATRFARYPLLINAIIKRSGESADVTALKQVVDKVKRALDEIDLRTGKGAESIRIRQISQRLELSKSARDSLALDAPARRLIKEGVFSVAEGGQVLVFLFDNSLIMATESKVAHAKGISRYIADERIIPISMLDATVPAAETGALMGIREVFGLQTGRSALMRHTPSSSSMKGRQAGATASGRAPLTFLHIACRTLCRTLLASSVSDRDAWIEAVHRRVCVPQTLVEAYTETRILSDRDFVPGRAPTCSAPFLSSTGCQMILFGNKD